MRSHPVIIRRILIPKAGHSPVECEDAISVNMASLRFAVADGATEAYDSKRWAKLLCRTWTALSNEPLADAQIVDCLSAIGNRFSSKSHTTSTAWYVEAHAAQGSFATFIGLSLHPTGSSSGDWHVYAVGDCCMLVLDPTLRVESFPLSHSSEFTSHPLSVPSELRQMRHLDDLVKCTTGRYGPGHAFLLLSDAIAHFFMKTIEDDPTRLRHLIRAVRDDTATFREQLCVFQQERAIRNDDLALLYVECMSDEVGLTHDNS